MPESYAKPSLSPEEQIRLLKGRGLSIENEKKALHLLRHISYYRLSGYWYPLLQEPKRLHRFKQTASFNNAFTLYCFDRELRQLVLGEIEKIEVAVRAQMINTLSHAFGPLWYTDATRFSNHRNRHDKILRKLAEDFIISQEEFIVAFRRKYADPYPPCWIIMELASFGQISTLYSDMKGGKSKRIIAKHFGLDDTTFASWLHCIVYLRNLCAHHSRFWNREFGIRPQIPRSPLLSWLSDAPIKAINGADKGTSNSRAFHMLSILLYFLQTVNPNSSFGQKFLKLTSKYPNIDLDAMGFPTAFEREVLWGKKPI
ncbi:MAG: Abi family protein [Chlorobiaceae bacterium]|nr:Abi family protein [Chlorobiaceae bacterium]